MVAKLKEIYRGKAKTMYETDNPKALYCEFRNDISAFNAEKLANLDRKGLINNHFNAFIMQHLENEGVETHFIEKIGETASLVKKLKMFPLECVVRNLSAGSLCKRLGIEKNQPLNPPVFEFFYKNDKLGDPLINESHIITFKWATAEEIAQMKALTFRVNEILSKLFKANDLLLADYKLEFGLFEGRIILADEFTPDGCRIWDAKTLEIFDKDRFRQDLGNVVESYELVARRLNIPLK
ncbi:MAG: phosphoribosylaminoimidazolesuccinocarboxamide synthase [Candidatus Berkiella sp.]